jgi:GntR family transcriptional regulator
MPRSYAAIARDLEAQIRAGIYPPGSRLPSYAELAKEHDVSVTTAQNAIRVLRTKGLVIGESGVGTFVVDPLPGP